MHYADIKKADIANGLGVRVSVFVSGCTHHCKNCFNSEAWDFNYGKKFTEETEEEINITFNNFIKEISSYVEPSTKNQKIKVNIIKIKKTKVINSTPNPDYIAYEEQKANIRELASKDKDDIAIKEFLLKTPPNKTIDNMKNVKKFKKNLENEFKILKNNDFYKYFLNLLEPKEKYNEFINKKKFNLIINDLNMK